MTHVVFQECDVAVLRKAIALDPALEGEVIEIKDEYAVGPVKDIYMEEAINSRKQWWRDVLAGGDYEGLVDDGHVNDPREAANLISRLKADPEENVWIWAAQNKHDVSGYYWLMSQLKDFQGRIYILYLNNLPFFNEKGSIFYPKELHSIPPKEFLKAKKLARLITPGEFEVDADEWKKLGEEDKVVRLLEGGKKLVQRDDDFYDDELRKYINPDWQKASKIIFNFLSKSTETTGDAYLLWRLKQMLARNEFEAQGAIKGMKDFEVRRRVEAPSQAEV